MEYPEHEKLQAVADKSQAIGEFLEWLSTEKHIVLAQNDEEGWWLNHYTTSTQKLLSEYFGINRNKLEQEKKQMLAAFNTKSN